jgi:hypothetical protein
MVCEFDDGKGWCTGKFKGFGCVKSKCELYTPNPDKKSHCSESPRKGVYCYKFNRFFCAGLNDCIDSASYFRKMEASLF